MYYDQWSDFKNPIYPTLFSSFDLKYGKLRRDFCHIIDQLVKFSSRTPSAWPSLWFKKLLCNDICFSSYTFIHDSVNISS